MDEKENIKDNSWEPEDAATVYFLIREAERKEEEEKKKAKESELSGKFFPL